MGSPKFSTLLFLHARRSDPDRPSGISPCLCLRSNFVFSVCCLVSRQCHIISTLVRTNDSSVLASRVLTLSPSALLTLTRLKSLQGGAATPLAYKMLCVRFTPVVHVCYSSLPFATLSVRGATLDTGGWLALTRDHLHLSPTGTCTRQEAPSFAWRTSAAPSGNRNRSPGRRHPAALEAPGGGGRGAGGPAGAHQPRPPGG